MHAPTVLHIFTAPEHGAPMISSQSVQVHQDRGIEGDRYFNASNRQSPDYQLTLIETEIIDAFNARYATRLSPDAPRRNIVTSGVRLNDLCGRQFKIGSVVLEGIELCEPCRLFQIRTDRRTLEFSIGRGGLRTRVLSGGVLEVGASVDAIVQQSHASRRDASSARPRARTRMRHASRWRPRAESSACGR